MNSTMLAARLHGPRDMRVERVPALTRPEPGQALIRVEATGICGSDLHSYQDARIGDTRLESPLVLGHEFSGTVLELGADCSDGLDDALRPGQLVAVDPATPCHRCEFCERGHPNLCRRLHFCGLWPDDGSLREKMLVPARSCFPLPAEIDAIEGSLLEPLGIALHAVDLGRIRVEQSAAIVGAGPIGLLILKVALLAGANPVVVVDPLPWRLERARQMGAHLTMSSSSPDLVQRLLTATDGRGFDTVFEAAWGGSAVETSIEIACLGGRVVLVGIPCESSVSLPAAPARRKGLTVLFARRMKHTYPRAIRMKVTRKLCLADLVTHRFPLTRADQAFALNAAYQDGVVKAVVLPD